jgi:hypothetical protein
MLERFLESPGPSLIRFERCFQKELTGCLVFIKVEESAWKSEHLDPRRMPIREYATPVFFFVVRSGTALRRPKSIAAMETGGH